LRCKLPGDYIAYGQKVKELLSRSDAEAWIEDLWDMYTGFMLFSQEAGYDPRGHDRFVSFKELVFFFQDVGKMKQSTGRTPLT
jgi:hypothetical protein